MTKVGYGVVTREGNEFHYKGSLPDCSSESRVAVIRLDELEEILASNEALLLSTRQTMPKGMVRELPDEFLVSSSIRTLKDNGQKMFLDRHLYSHNYRDEIWIRYADVDQFFYEEGANPPNGGPHERGKNEKD